MRIPPAVGRTKSCRREMRTSENGAMAMRSSPLPACDIELAQRLGRCELAAQAHLLLRGEGEELLAVRDFQAVAVGHVPILPAARNRCALTTLTVACAAAHLYNIDGVGLCTTAVSSSSVNGSVDSSQP